MEFSNCWNILVDYIKTSKKHTPQNMNDIDAAAKYLASNGFGPVLWEWFYQTLVQDLSTTVSPKFWSQFQEPLDEQNIFSHLNVAFSTLHSQVFEYLECVMRLSSLKLTIDSDTPVLQLNGSIFGILPVNDPKKLTSLLLKSVVFFETNKNLLNALHLFYFKAFKAFDVTTKTPDLDDSGMSDEESLCCDGCGKEKDECLCQEIMHTFHHLNKQWRELGLLDCLSGEAVTSLIKQRVKHHVEHTCKGNFEIQYLQILQQWLEKKVVGWLELLYGSSEDISSPIKAHKDRLYHSMYVIYAKVRIEQLFNIIIEYPESEPALLDLKACLEKINLRNELVTSLTHALETRLLHPGVNTTDILTAYISAIRSLRVLDPAGVLLDLVCQPVRSYLRQRKDTVRCIVTSLTEDGNSDLSDELGTAQPLQLSDSYHSDDADPNEDWQNWQPDPVDADPLKGSGRRSSDIISMLVNIYGSKDMFVNEYQTLLAERILTNFNYDTEKEIRYLELLKLRFGEADLHNCEVMLKDVGDSKRINVNIAAKKEKERRATGNLEVEETIPVNGMILSAQFWPAFREEKMELPGDMKHALEKYTKSFEALKGNRTLNWKPHLGLIDLELELEDRMLKLSVSPVQATIIWHFQTKPTWTIDDLSSEMHMSAQALRRKIAFWQSHGLLKEESADCFVLVEKQTKSSSGRHHDTVTHLDDEETESAMASAQDLKEEESQVVWQFIVGMLTNLESLPLDRIHSMLKMFAMQGPGSEYTMQELKAFLDKKVKDQKLLCTSGVYRLVR